MRQEARGMPLWHSPRKQARRPGLVTARKKIPQLREGSAGVGWPIAGILRAGSIRLVFPLAL